MQAFTHYKINQTDDGIEVILYLNAHATEFSAELGTSPKMEEETIEKEAVSYVRRMFPSLKVKSVKVMAGAMLVTTLGLGALTTTQASAAESTVPQTQLFSSAYTVKAGDTLSEIAKRSGTTVHAIKQANQLPSDLIRIGQTLTIPNGGTSAPSGNVTAPAQTNGTTYRVVAGDTLSEIAARNGTTVQALKQANQLSTDLIRIGQTLTIPNGGTSAPSGNITAPAQTNGTTYRVVVGDTLSEIAARNGTTVKALKQANQLSSDLIRIGQTLTIPNGGTSAPSSNTTAPTQTNGSTYRVVAGDTLSEIAARSGTTVQALKQANQLSSDLIRVGQTLTIPTGAISPSATGNTVNTPTEQAKPSPTTQNEQQSEVNEEVEWLAKMIYSEARGETMEGQIAVGAVIMNRVASPLFPNNVKDVLLEKSYGYYQFTPAETGSIYTATPTEQNIEAAERAIAGEDPTNGALFFYNPDKTSSDYLRSRTVSKVIGNHTFAF